MVPRGGSTTATAGYSFSSQPKPVAASRKKYREPGEDLNDTKYRSLKETCITWDQRVHRGNTYGMYTQKAIKESVDDALREAEPTAVRRRRPKEKSIFDMPLPEIDRVPVDLTDNLVAKEVVVETKDVEAETDEFLPEPPPPPYVPQKTGIDVATQVEDGEIFHFDDEVEPILDVIVNKTLEQAVMEVEEEHEMAEMKDFKGEWHQRQQAMMKDWHEQVEAERARWKQKEAVLAQKRAQKKREAQVLLKIQAMDAAKVHLQSLVPHAVGELREMAFPDDKGMAITRLFLPELLGQVQEQVRARASAQSHAAQAVATAFEEHRAARAAAVRAHAGAHKAEALRRHEESQIRRGRIKISLDVGQGEVVTVGPVQISEQDGVGDIESRVYEWMQANQAETAARLPFGVLLQVAGEQPESAAALFDAKAGQISVVPKPEPPAPPRDPAEGEEGEGAGEEEAVEEEE